MKLLFFTIALSLAVATAVVAHFHVEQRDLSSFCQSLPVGMALSEVREAASEHGYGARMEPFVQMRIEPVGWHYARPSCRVFFNKERTIEYRVWQDG